MDEPVMISGIREVPSPPHPPGSYSRDSTCFPVSGGGKSYVGVGVHAVDHPSRAAIAPSLLSDLSG